MRYLSSGPRAAAILIVLGAAVCSGQAHALTLTEYVGSVAVGQMLPWEDEALPPLELTEADAIDGEQIAELIAGGALSMLGTDYEFGSRSDEAVDCSSLVQRVYRAAGLEMPRTTREQVGLGVPVRMTELRKGDLVFYRWKPRSLHVAVYMDDGYIVHASPGRGHVVMTRVNKAWQRRMVAARRLL
ncbi:MAG TPA: C40 family peptidase [Solimonas sp.]|nr:C40 family peptidase [Solimonas sp.]